MSLIFQMIFMKHYVECNKTLINLLCASQHLYDSFMVIKYCYASINRFIKAAFNVFFFGGWGNFILNISKSQCLNVNSPFETDHSNFNLAINHCLIGWIWSKHRKWFIATLHILELGFCFICLCFWKNKNWSMHHNNRKTQQKIT